MPGKDGDGNVWDDDFAESPDLARFAHGKPPLCSSRAGLTGRSFLGRAASRGKEEIDNAKTIRPIKSPSQSFDLASANSLSAKARDDAIPKYSSKKPVPDDREDFSADLEFDETSFSQKVLRIRVRQGLSAGG